MNAAFSNGGIARRGNSAGLQNTPECRAACGCGSAPGQCCTTGYNLSPDVAAQRLALIQSIVPGAGSLDFGRSWRACVKRYNATQYRRDEWTVFHAEVNPAGQDDLVCSPSYREVVINDTLNAGTGEGFPLTPNRDTCRLVGEIGVRREVLTKETNGYVCRQVFPAEDLRIDTRSVDVNCDQWNLEPYYSANATNIDPIVLALLMPGTQLLNTIQPLDSFTFNVVILERNRIYLEWSGERITNTPVVEFPSGNVVPNGYVVTERSSGVIEIAVDVAVECDGTPGNVRDCNLPPGDPCAGNLEYLRGVPCDPNAVIRLLPFWLADNVKACRYRQHLGQCWRVSPDNPRVSQANLPPNAQIITDIISANSSGPFSCCECDPSCGAALFTRERCDGSETTEPLSCCCSDSFSARMLEFRLLDSITGPGGQTYEYTLLSGGLLRYNAGVQSINNFYQVRARITDTATGGVQSDFTGDFPLPNPINQCGVWVLQRHPNLLVALGANFVPTGCPLQVGRTFVLPNGIVAYVRGLAYGHGCNRQSVTGSMSYYPPGTPTIPAPVSGEIGESTWEIIWRVDYDSADPKCQGDCAGLTARPPNFPRLLGGCSGCAQKSLRPLGATI